MRDISVYDGDRFVPVSLTLEELLANLDNYKFSHICVNPVVEVNNTVRWHFTDEKHPIAIGEFIALGEYLGFDEKYYTENREKVDAAVVEICRNIKKDYFRLEQPFIGKEFFKAVCENPNIKTLVIGSMDDVYSLTKEDYELFKNSSIEGIQTYGVDEELKDVFDEKILFNKNKRIVLNHSYDDLCKTDNLYIEESLNDEEIVNIKYLNDGARVQFRKLNDFENVFKVIQRLRELGKGNKISIEVQSRDDYDYKNEFNDFIFSHPEVLDNDIDIKVGIMEVYSLTDYVKYEKRLIEMIRPALNLSPLEKFLFAYNIAKKYKKYKENEENRSESRNLYKILDGEFMVCVGYATLLEDLLTKLGIKAAHYSVTVDTSLDSVPDDALVIPEEIENSSGGHARAIIHLVDPKYGIDGLFISDPTWDNDMEHDSYVHALMSPDEYNGLRRYNYLEFYNVREMLFVHSLEEFYEKANVWLKKTENRDARRINKSMEEQVKKFQEALTEFMEVLEPLDREAFDWFVTSYANLFKMQKPANNIERFVARVGEVVDRLQNKELKEKFNTLRYRSNNIKYSQQSILNNRKNALQTFMKNMIASFKDYDMQKYYELKEKYKDLEDSRFVFSEEYVQEFMLEVGEYIVSRVNAPISGEVLMSAIREMFDKTGEYTPEELDERIASIIEFNRESQSKSFPTRYQVLDDGTRIPIMNETNKFDIGKGLGI